LPHSGVASCLISRTSIRHRNAFHHPLHRGMLAVFHLHPILRPPGLVRSVTPLRDQALKAHIAGGEKQVGANLALFKGRDKDAAWAPAIAVQG
jgi:hypothetical protein